MKLKRSLQHVTTCKSDAQKKKNGNALVHNFVALSACAALAMIFILLILHLNSSPVYQYITAAIL